MNFDRNSQSKVVSQNYCFLLSKVSKYIIIRLNIYIIYIYVHMYVFPFNWLRLYILYMKRSSFTFSNYKNTCQVYIYYLIEKSIYLIYHNIYPEIILCGVCVGN